MQTATAILLFGVVIMTCGSCGLLLVRLASPQLRGTGWLGFAFFHGALGAALLAMPSHAAIRVPAAAICLLASFVLLHVAVLRVLERGKVPLLRGAFLLLAQLTVNLLWLGGYVPFWARVLSMGTLVAFQSAVTAARLLQARRRPGVRAPGIFISVLLLGFGAFNLIRGIVSALTRNTQLSNQLALVAFVGYIAVALGLAFGFFWMTTSILTGEMEEAASTDPLTRVFNRRIFLRWCDRELARSSRSGVPFSLLMVDLDHFKQVNDTYGHQAGDEVLCSAVEKMQDAVRGIDVLCRWGGEEFAVLLPNASVEATRLVAERIRANVLRTELSEQVPETTRQQFQLTTSIGTATYRDVEDGVSAMLQRADEALYAAKRNGRNQVLVST